MVKRNEIRTRRDGLLLLLGLAVIGASALGVEPVIEPPAINEHPHSLTVTEGADVSFVVGVTGTYPMAFSWYFNSVPLSITSTNRLDLVGVRASQAGTYSVVVTNPGGTAGSKDAILTVTPAPPITSNLVVHLTFDGHLNDASGRNNHGAAVGAPAFVPGLLGLSGLNVFSTSDADNYVTLGVAPDLQFGATTDFTVTFWARLPEGAWGGDPNSSAIALISNQDRQDQSRVGWTLAAGFDGSLQWSYAEQSKLVEYNGAPGTFGSTAWHHVAVAFQRGDSARTYLDGLLLDTRPLVRHAASLDTGLPLNIGRDGKGHSPVAPGYWTNPDGLASNGMCLDDLGIWQRALTTQDIIAIYSAGLIGRDLSNATLADAIGGLPPRITQQPAAQAAVGGVDVMFSVAAAGSPPLSYQWRKDGIPIPGATNALLTLVSVEIADGGNYSVVVTNLAGGDTSLAVPLTVTNSVRQGWAVRLDGSANRKDAFTDVKVDGQSNLLVTGYTASERSGDDFLTAKYRADGQLLWQAPYDGPGGKDDRAAAVAVDQAGHVFVAGSSRGADNVSALTTIRYDADGNQVWVARYAAQAGQDATAAALAPDGAGNVFVAGTATLGDHLGYAILKYDAAGVLLWAARYAGTANTEDHAAAMALDPAGNVYVTGRSKGFGSDFDYATVKYDRSGSMLWAARYNGSGNGPDQPAALVVDASGNAFVTGQSTGVGGDLDVATIKYSPSGEVLWVFRYESPSHQADIGTDLAIDAEGNVVVVGATRQGATNFDYLTLKYSANGAMLWQAVYDGPGSASDQARAVGTDAAGNIYLAGSSKGAGTRLDVATLKYTPEGHLSWTARYNGRANGDDTAYGLALPGGNSVVVAGASRGIETDQDASLIQYQQPVPPVILTQPISQVAVAGSDVLFAALAEGTPPLFWQWRLNQVPIAGATNATLVLSNVQPSDRGRYQVVVWNAASAAESDTADLMVNAANIPWADNFGDRGVITTLTGLGQGSNVGATREPGEPHHNGKTGGKSVWLSWRAPSSGIATFTTAGSDFDTVLAVYVGSSVATLGGLASDDDRGGFLTSQVIFNATAGSEYQIAVDGVNGSSGNVVLSWAMEITNARVPVITSLSPGQTAGLGEQVTFSVSVDEPGAAYQWFRDGVSLAGAEQNTLTIPNAQPSDVGLYYVRVIASNREVLSQWVYLQINQSDGGVQRDLAALDKFADVVQLTGGVRPGAPGGRPNRPIQLLNAPARGYSGTQIFSTYAATTEPGEPANCGVPGGASAWYSYQAPISATLYVSTDGSDFDTTLAVYTGDGSSFDRLTLVACDNDSGADGRSSAVRLPATAGTTYYMAVDGVNGATGHVVLNHNLGDPPVIVTQPLSQNVPPGGSTTLSVAVSGTMPCAFQWRFNGSAIPGATQATLAIANAQPGSTGNYSVVVSNLINVAFSTEARLTVRQPTVAISGGISTWESGRPVPNVICQLSGTIYDAALSSLSGSYVLNADWSGNYHLTPVKADDTPPAVGVTTLDIALMRQRILGLSMWDSPYRLLAADVNQSGTITTLDLALVRQVILGITSSFPPGLWRFVPSNYVFPDARNPWGAPGARSYTSLTADIPGQDFIAIKLGDVNGSALSPSATGSPVKSVTTQSRTTSSQLSVRFEASSHTAQPGELLKTTVAVSGFQQVTTAQFALAWDPAVLRYLGVGNFGVPGLSEGSFGTAQARDGILRVSWDDPATAGVTVADNTVLFTVSFEVVGAPGSASRLAFADRLIPREATVALALAQFESQDGQVAVGKARLFRGYRLDTDRGVFELSVATALGVHYVLEFNESLSGTPWTALSTFVGDGTEQLLTIPGATHWEGFYRLRTE